MPSANDDTLEQTLATPDQADTPEVVVLPARYEDLGPIAAGSFGEVHRVRDTLLDRVVAMKLMRKEHAARPELRQRFLTEATITAQLQHPGIVSLHDRGELPDGRLWFTMKEVRGRTLAAVIRELHTGSGPDAWRPTSDGFTFRRLVDAFARISQAMAYAHSRRIVHRDLKPANLMVGEFGEVLVMDWGLARKLLRDVAGSTSAGTDKTDSTSVRLDARSAGLTRQGDVVGTPAFMAPEQARGDSTSLGPASDVYALGAVLYCLLVGAPPYRDGGAREVIHSLLSGPPPPVMDAARGGPPVPDELGAIVTRAMHREIDKRYPSAAALANDVVAWLDGVRRREQALAALEHARSFEPEIAEHRASAADAEAKAQTLRADLRSFDPVDKKRPAWALEDEAARASRAAALAETRWMEAVQGALSIDPDLAEAHAMLADHHRARLVEAEGARRDDEAARAEEMLRIHDRGRHAAFLRGEGRLTLVTEPPGAELISERLELVDRRLVAVETRALGSTPLVAAPLSRGSYVLRLRAPGCVEVRYPVLVERDAHWDGCAPGETAPYPIVLPRLGSLGPDDVYVPAGWCWVGGDEATPDSLPRRRVWIDAFVMRRYPVTTGEYLTFLNDLIAHGREVEALGACPKGHEGSDNAGEPLFLRGPRGVFELPPGSAQEELDRPVVLVDWHGAMAHAHWLAKTTGQSWRLPDELEREKAARGVDGRLLPWGDQNEPTFACVTDTRPTAAAREVVIAHPYDESPYGIRGLAGNTRDWCINLWKHAGPSIESDRLRIEPAAAQDPDFRVIKGGAWTAMMISGRAAARFGGRPDLRRQSFGFRLVRTAR
ncbi:MAG: SUMF1/EgtB/PvdO family nonheme iron enzyme [Polyangiaceae bacterium]|nr:SUMF1/EgtB/PvdO family nonheme iron enzyme [Polyangiaceae bacterium]